MDEEYHLWYHDLKKVVHDILSNLDFNTTLDYAPHQKFCGGYCDFMSGNWAWNQCVSVTLKECLRPLSSSLSQDIIVLNPRMHGCMYVSIILGFNKTTVCVATGQNKCYPVYLSVGNIHNNIHRAHKDALSLIRFLLIPEGNTYILLTGDAHVKL